MKLPMFMSDKEKELYDKTLKEEKDKVNIKRSEERKVEIMKKAKKKARPLKEKIKGKLEALSRIKLREL